MILQTGQEINELDNSGFFTEGPTVFTGNIGKSSHIVQVGPKFIIGCKNFVESYGFSLGVAHGS